MMNKFCSTHNITERQFLGLDKISGSLYLNGLTSIPKGFNPTVGGSLYLNGLTSIPEGFSPTVGGSLFLNGLTAIPEGFSPTVGGDIELNGLTSIPEGFNKDSFRTLIQSWQDEKYICADGIFAEALKRKRNVWKVKKIQTDREFYLVTDGQGKFAHGETMKEARADLMFKLSDNADKEKYAYYTEFTLAEAIECYRLVTGACAFGVKDFVANHEMKEVFEVSDIITMTEGYYGHETFKAFFSK